MFRDGNRNPIRNAVMNIGPVLLGGGLIFDSLHATDIKLAFAEIVFGSGLPIVPIALHMRRSDRKKAELLSYLGTSMAGMYRNLAEKTFNPELFEERLSDDTDHYLKSVLALGFAVQLEEALPYDHYGYEGIVQANNNARHEMLSAIEGQEGLRIAAASDLIDQVEKIGHFASLKLEGIDAAGEVIDSMTIPISLKGIADGAIDKLQYDRPVEAKGIRRIIS